MTISEQEQVAQQLELAEALTNLAESYEAGGYPRIVLDRAAAFVRSASQRGTVEESLKRSADALQVAVQRAMEDDEEITALRGRLRAAEEAIRELTLPEAAPTSPAPEAQESSRTQENKAGSASLGADCLNAPDSLDAGGNAPDSLSRRLPNNPALRGDHDADAAAKELRVQHFFAAFQEETKALIHQKILNRTDAADIASAFARIAADVAAALLSSRAQVEAQQWVPVSTNEATITRGVAWVDWECTHIGKFDINGKRYLMPLPKAPEGGK